MAFERIRIEAGGVGYEGWMSVAVTAAYDEAVRTFTITTSEPPSSLPILKRWPLLPNMPVSVTASGTLLVTGFVDDYMPAFSEESHDVTISGRGRGAEYVDSSIVHPTGRFEDKTMLQIAQELDTFGVGITVQGLGAAVANQLVPWFQIRPGATPWAEMMRLLPQGATMMGLPEGGIAIVRGATGRHAGGLIEGGNVKAASAKLSAREGFSAFEAMGQNPIGTTDAQLRPLGYFMGLTKSARTRHRRFHDPVPTTPARAKDLAQWVAQRAAGNSIEVSATVAGFRDQSGAVWRPSQTVFTHLPTLNVEQDLIIRRVTFRQDDQSGTVSEIDLCDAQTFGGSAAPASGSHEVYIPSKPDDVDPGMRGPR